MRSKLEYATSAWDPHAARHCNNIEMVQRRAARFVVKDYDITSSVSKIISDLGWDSLAKRRTFARLKNFYLVYNGIGGWVDLMEYLEPPARLGRSEHPHSVRTKIPRTDIGKFSFITRTAAEWNGLPEEVFNPEKLSFGSFKSRLTRHLDDND